MSKQYHNSHSHPGLTIFCLIMTLIILAACTLGGLQLWGKDNAKPSNWFKGEDAPAVQEEIVKYETILPQNGGMILDEKIENGEEDDTGVKSNGIALMSAAIPVAQYAAYGISPAAETARTVTATVSPDNEASNTKIKWELSWKNAASEWATNKEVTDYVTVQSNADDLMESKTCTVSCSQAFGEQIILKAIAVDDEEKFATCNVDYIRQVKSVSVSIGDVSVNLGGKTDVTIAIRRDYNGKGGKVTANTNYSDVYTIDNEFETSIILSKSKDFINAYEESLSIRKNFSFAYGSKNELSCSTQQETCPQNIYFDQRIFAQFNFAQFQIKKDGTFADSSTNFFELYPESEESGGWLYWKNFTSDEIKTCYNNLHCQGKVLFTMKISLTSGSYEYTYESDLIWAAIDETVPAGDVSINDGKDIEFP